MKIGVRSITEFDNVEIPQNGVILQKGKRHFLKIAFPLK